MVQHVKCAMFIQTFFSLWCHALHYSVLQTSGKDEEEGKKSYGLQFLGFYQLELGKKSCLKKSGSSLKKVTVDEEQGKRKIYFLHLRLLAHFLPFFSTKIA